MIFFFKKTIAKFFFPVSLCVTILLLGLCLLWFSQRQKLGKVIITIGLLLIILLGNEPFSEMLLKPIEYKYPSPYTTASSADALIDRMKTINYIVILGAGHINNPKLTLTSQLSETSLIRLIEGINLHRLIPGSKLILMEGSRYGDPLSGADLMAQIAQKLGVDPLYLILEKESRDTEDQRHKALS